MGLFSIYDTTKMAYRAYVGDKYVVMFQKSKQVQYLLLQEFKGSWSYSVVHGFVIIKGAMMPSTCRYYPQTVWLFTVGWMIQSFLASLNAMFKLGCILCYGYATAYENIMICY